MNAQASLEIDSLHEGVDFYTSVTRAKFEDLCSDLFKKTIDHVSKAIADAGLEKSKVPFSPTTSTPFFFFFFF